MEHLIEMGQLINAQHRFLPKRSCATQLLTSLEDWMRLMENGDSVDVAYLDFRKAFDSVHSTQLCPVSLHPVYQMEVLQISSIP